MNGPHRPRLVPALRLATLPVALLIAAVSPHAALAAQDAAPTADARCAALAAPAAHWMLPSLRITSAVAHAAGPLTEGTGMGPPRTLQLPAHCEIQGLVHERVGQDGDHYAIHFHLRLPNDWNGRFVFQGGGGTDGNLGNAVGLVSLTAPPALASGYAVVSDDGGHDNAVNNAPQAGGVVSFGRDAQARADYGHAALKATYDASRELIRRFYARDPEHAYFAGCSKGGQEALAFAERYPEAFDGILAGAPAMSLPKAAVNHAWDAQAFASAASHDPGPLSVAAYVDSFSNEDLALVRRAVLEACDADDGAKDGIVGDYTACSDPKVMPQLRRLQCTGDKSAGCLAPAQIAALQRALQGAHDSKGKALYVPFPWDAGFSDAGWRVWKIGLPAGNGPAGPPAPVTPIIVGMGASSLAEVFSTPPRIIGPTPQAGLDYLLAYNFDTDAPAIFAKGPGFAQSAWEEISARSTNLDRFIAHGGRLLVYHGVSDPVFSINDTMAWWREVDQRYKGHGADNVRLYPVPGMGHCAGGPATDSFDGFGALVNWVEKHQAPQALQATAGPASPWPGRTRPLCPYPQVARYSGSGSLEKAESFACVAPGGEAAARK